MDLQTRLVSLRKQKGLTQLDLAEKLNVSRQAISRWEVGAAVPSTDNLKVLSELYGVSVDYLLNGKNDGCKNNDSPAQKEQGPKSSRRNYRGAMLFIASLTLALAITATICISVMNRKESEQITPIADMETMVEDCYPTVTFSFG